MKFAYEKSFVVSAPGFEDGTIYQPKIAITLAGPSGECRFKAIVDSGSDQTIFPLRDVAELTGITIDRSLSSQVKGRLEDHKEVLFLGRNCELSLASDGTICQWPAVMWFSEDDSAPAIIGHSGFLEFFRLTLDGPRKEIELIPGENFPGQIKKAQWEQ